MTVFNNEYLIERIEQMDLEAARDALSKIVMARMPETARSSIGRILTGLDHVKRDNIKRKISKGREVPLSTLENLYRSPVMNYVEELILAALDPRGPFQSREIMMLASSIKGGHAEYITADGIPQAYKNQAGHILTMAGFERRSHYDKERKIPVKAWKLKHGSRRLTAAELAQEVRVTIRHLLNVPDEPFQTPAPTTNLLGGFM